jgi:hypothetical protein
MLNRNVKKAGLFVVSVFGIAMMVSAQAPQPVSKVNLDVEDQGVGSPIKTQSVSGTILKPTYVSEGEGLSAKVADVPALKGKALVVGDSSEPLSQNIAFTIDPIKNGKYSVKFDYIPLKSGNSHIVVFDMRNSATKQILTLAMTGNMKDLSFIIDGKDQLFSDILAPDKAANFDFTVNIDKWTYELSVNGKKLTEGALNTLDDHSLISMVFWTPGTSEFAIKNLVADKIK